jgi:hypothetical protein
MATHGIAMDTSQAMVLMAAVAVAERDMAAPPLNIMAAMAGRAFAIFVGDIKNTGGNSRANKSNH